MATWSPCSWELDQTHHNCAGVSKQGEKRRCVCHRPGAFICILAPDPSNVSSKSDWQSKGGLTSCLGSSMLFSPAWTLSLGPGHCIRTHSFTYHSVISLFPLKELSICLFISHSFNPLHLGFHLYHFSETAHIKSSIISNPVVRYLPYLTSLLVSIAAVTNYCILRSLKQ